MKSSTSGMRSDTGKKFGLLYSYYDPASRSMMKLQASTTGNLSDSATKQASGSWRTGWTLLASVTALWFRTSPSLIQLTPTIR